MRSSEILPYSEIQSARMKQRKSTTTNRRTKTNINERRNVSLKMFEKHKNCMNERREKDYFSTYPLINPYQNPVTPFVYGGKK